MAARLDPDELAALEEQRAFLLRSLDDLEREHEAGDLDTNDFETLRDDYTARAAEILRAIEQQHRAFADARRPRSMARTAAVFAGVLAFAVLAGWLVASSMGAREAGDSATGGIGVRQSPSQRAQACQQLMDPQSPTEAIECFRDVLEEDERNVVALSFLAWQLELSAPIVGGDDGEALSESARTLVERAIEHDPNYSYARAFRAVIAYRDGEYELAQQYLDDFRAGDPSSDAESVIVQMELDERIGEALAEGA